MVANRLASAIFAFLLAYVPQGIGGTAGFGGKAGYGGGFTTPSSVACGDNTIEATTEGGWSNLDLSGAKCVPGSNVVVDDCQIYTVAAGSGMACGVWDSNGTYNGTTGEPGTILCFSSSIVPATNGWNLIAISGCGTLTSGHTYWVGPYTANGDNTTSYKHDATANYSYYVAVAGGVGHPDTFTSFSARDSKFSSYLDVH